MGLTTNNPVGVVYASGVKTNEPTQYGDRQKAYLEERSKLYYDKRSYLSTDYVNARVQGLTDTFEDFTECKVRLSDLIPEVISTTKKMDDWKLLMIPSRSVSYLPLGAKVETMGSTYIAANVSNISSVSCTAILARCNAIYRTYDAYGNILSEPIHIERYDMTGNDDKDPYNIVIPNGNFRITCQSNEITRTLHNDSRLILGGNAFQITGIMDFLEEFTGDFDSTHYMTFTCRVVEPVENDDMVNRIANGLAMSFSAELNGVNEIPVGGSADLEAAFLVNGEQSDLPYSFNFASSDETVLTVQNGVALGVGEGTATITATLAENPGVTVQKAIKVQGVLSPRVAFSGDIPAAITQYTSAEIYAYAYDANGDATLVDEWQFSGADGSNYTAEEIYDGEGVKITCLSPSASPLVVTATSGDLSASCSILLEGY